MWGGGEDSAGERGEKGDRGREMWGERLYCSKPSFRQSHQM